MSTNGENMVNAKESNLGQGKGERWLPLLLLKGEMDWVIPERFWLDKTIAKLHTNIRTQMKAAYSDFLKPVP